MITGKNLVNFAFLYLVGSQIKETRQIWEKINVKGLFICYLLFNLLLVIVYTMYYDTRVGNIIWLLNFPYSSPFLLVNSILLFILFGRIRIQSRSINWMAKSSFAIYLIHANRPYVIGAIGCAALWILKQTDNEILIIIGCVGLTLIVLVASIVIDKLLTPIWKQMDILGNKLSLKLGY